MAADTDPREGAAIAVAALEQLVGAGAQVLITTHLEELKALGLTDPRFASASVGFDVTRLAPTYHLALGAAGASSAIEIARRVGMPEALCLRAREILGGGSSAIAQALEKLEREQAGLAAARAEAQEARAKSGEGEDAVRARAARAQGARAGHPRRGARSVDRGSRAAAARGGAADRRAASGAQHGPGGARRAGAQAARGGRARPRRDGAGRDRGRRGARRARGRRAASGRERAGQGCARGAEAGPRRERQARAARQRRAKSSSCLGIRRWCRWARCASRSGSTS